MIKLKLGTDWKLVLRRAWSVRLLAVAIVLSAVEVVMPFADGWLPRGWLALATLAVTVAALVARVIAQRDL